MQTTKKIRKYVEEPTMSDKTLLLNVEDLINVAFGIAKQNAVNFKMLQTVLHILARQMRLLEQEVEIRLDDAGIEIQQPREGEDGNDETSSTADDASRREDEGRGGGRGRGGLTAVKRRGQRDGEREDDQGGGQGGEGKGGRGGGRQKPSGGGGGGKRSGDRGGERGKERGRKGEPTDRTGAPESKSTPESQEKGADKEESLLSITVSETKSDKGDKILVVEKVPRTEGRVGRVGSIEVVTASQFALLEKAVEQLKTVSGPLPEPSMPENEKLRKDLAKGTASLTDTMQAMKLNARVQAAEEGLTRMAGMLTQLVAAGALPQDMLSRINEMHRDLQQAAGPGAEAGGILSKKDKKEKKNASTSTTAGADQTGSRRKSVAIDLMSTAASATSRPEFIKRPDDRTTPSVSRMSVMPRASVVSSIGTSAVSSLLGVTHAELHDVMENMKEDLIKEINAVTAKATQTSEAATNLAKSVVNKLDIALKLDERITSLFSQTADYAEQLSGFDSGLTTQMASFQEQMAQMRHDLKAGLDQLAQANNNAESAALMDLNERYEGLVIDLDNTLHMHQNLSTMQKTLSDEIQSLVECVEMLREQKADRDEVFDGLRDKADISRLAGLLHEEDFRHAREELERRIEMCYDKFKKQDRIWLGAIKDLTTISEGKAEILQLLQFKDSAEDELRSIQDKLRQLFIMLGEPKAAMLMRKLAVGAACGACLVPALQEPQDRDYGKPAPLPALRPPPLAQDQPCRIEITEAPPDTREHVCHRWVGGSHTLMGGNVLREKAEASSLQTVPTRSYTGYGTDGKLYMLEEELQPCRECNMLSTDEQELGAGGDQATAPPTANKKSGGEKDSCEL